MTTSISSKASEILRKRNDSWLKEIKIKKHKSTKNHENFHSIFKIYTSMHNLLKVAFFPRRLTDGHHTGGHF